MDKVDILQMAFMIKDRLTLDMDKLYEAIKKEVSEDNISNVKIKNKYILMDTAVCDSDITKVCRKYLKKTIKKQYTEIEDDEFKVDKETLIEKCVDDALEIFLEISDEGNSTVLIEIVA